MYRLAAQWAIEAAKAAGKREQLCLLLREIGAKRFSEAIVSVIKNHDSEFWPPISIIRKHVIAPTDVKERNWWRDPNCPQCHGTGFYYVEDLKADELYKRKGALAVVRCQHPGCLQRKAG